MIMNKKVMLKDQTMFKKSLLSKEINTGMITINEETINLGNSSNTNAVFREHTFTVIRPDIFGFTNSSTISEKTDGMTKKLLGKTKGLLPVTKKNDNQLIDCEKIPDYVLINPSEWGSVIMKMKDGTEVEKKDNYDKLITLHQYIGYEKDISISFQFKLKVENV